MTLKPGDWATFGENFFYLILQIDYEDSYYGTSTLVYDFKLKKVRSTKLGLEKATFEKIEKQSLSLKDSK